MDVQARSVRLALGALGATLAMAAPAAAQSPVPTPTPTPPAVPTPAPPPPPAAGTLTVAAATPYRDGKRLVGLRGDRVQITGTLAPFVPGQVAVVRVKAGKKKLINRKLAIVPGPNGTGTFATQTTLRRTGTLSVQALHKATPQLAAAKARNVRLLVVKPAASYGSRGALVRML